MLLRSSLNLVLDHRGDDDDREFGDGTGNPEFPSGKLTSNPWAGWWHDQA
jgi:hypothetical protein